MKRITLVSLSLAALVLAMVWQGKEIESLLPTLGLFAAAAFRLMPSANRLLTAVHSLRYGLPALETLHREILQTEGTPLPGRGNPMPFHHSITLREVSYKYPNAGVPALDGLSLEDGAATLTAFTAGAVGKALDLLPQRPQRLILSGGGRRNPTLVKEIAKRAKVEPVMSEAVGWRGDAVEAECFAFLAVRALRGMPISFPLTTGVKQPITGGRLAMIDAAA